MDEFSVRLNNDEMNYDNSNLLIYERVRDSFNEPKFPSWKNSMYASLWIIGLLGASVSAIYSVETKNLFNLTWSVPLALVSIGAVIYAPNKHIKERIKFAEENYSEEREMIKENFQKLHNVAKKVQPLVSQYKSLFT